MIISTVPNISPFGGIHIIHRHLLANKIIPFINEQLGSRSANATYSYADLLLSLTYNAFCGGTATEDIHALKAYFKPLKGYQTPSADTLLAMQKQLATPSEEHLSNNGVTKNKININRPLNSLLLKMATYTGQLASSVKNYCLDFDHQHIVTDKYDATMSYKKTKGYFPGIASINNLPVYIENRNGNCSVQFMQTNTLKRVFDQLDAENISVDRCRMDAGSYIAEVTDYLSSRKGLSFYIRANKSATVLQQAACLDNWQDVQINYQKLQLNSLDYTFGEHTYRIVVYRKQDKQQQLNLLTGDTYKYQFIITNDITWSEQEIIEFYNHRGASEQLFDIQNNDFNWKHLPFSFLEENTVYLILMAVVHVLYKWLIHKLAATYAFLQPTDRLKKVRFRLINIVAKVIRSARQQIVKLLVPAGHFLISVPP